MADHGSSGSHSHGLEEHQRTYEGFIKGSVALTLLCLFLLVALVAFRFIGTIAVLIDFRAGSKWYLSGGLLVLYGLFIAILVA